jgi:hypothetical protein
MAHESLNVAAGAARERRRAVSLCRLAICSGVTLPLLFGSAASADPGSAGEMPSADTIYGAMCAGIERVSRGVVRVEDSILRASYAKPGKTSYLVTFDNTKQMLRCDRVHVDRNGQSRSTKYARTPAGSLFQLLQAAGQPAAIDIYPPDQDFSGSLDQPLDPHLLWFASSGGYLGRESYSAVKRNFFRRAPSTVVSRDKEGRFLLQWRNKTNQDMRTLTVDPARGFVPVRNEAATRSVGSAERCVTAWTEIRYSKKNGCWTPVSLDIHGAGLTIKVHCEWESVNQDIDPSVFATDGFEPVVGTPIWDLRGPKPVFLGTTPQALIGP